MATSDNEIMIPVSCHSGAKLKANKRGSVSKVHVVSYPPVGVFFCEKICVCVCVCFKEKEFVCVCVCF